MAAPKLAFDLGPRGGAGATRALKEMVRRRFALEPDASVFVAELACGETDCPDVETVIAVFLNGGRREFRLAKPVADIAEADLPVLAELSRGAAANPFDSD